MNLLLLGAVAAVGNLILSLGVVVSIVTEFRLWPPGERDWRYWLTWVIWYPATAAFIVVGVLDRGSLGVVPLAGRIAGGVVTFLGLVIAFKSIFRLGFSDSDSQKKFVF